MYFQKPCRRCAENGLFSPIVETFHVQHIAERISARNGKGKVGTDDDTCGAHLVYQIAKDIGLQKLSSIHR